MKKFNELLLSSQAIIIYFLSITVSIILLPFFSKIYYILYKPNFLVSGLYIITEPKLELYIGGFFAGCFFLVPFFVFLFIEKKKYLIWGIGISIPFILSLLNGFKYTFYSLLLSFLGWLLAQGILFFKKKKVN